VIPAFQEVAVIRATGRVTVRQDEAPAVVQFVEWLHVIPNLNEEGDDTDRVRVRTVSSVDVIGERHVRLVAD
jgi:hypothetical protein